jgi:hypothetical protein
MQSASYEPGSPSAASAWVTVRRVAFVPLIVVGSAVQGGGFILALRQAGITRREEVPDHAPLRRHASALLVREVERILVWANLRSPSSQAVALSGSARMKGEMRARLSFRRGGLPTEARFDALEGEVQDHRAKQQDELAVLAGRSTW